MIRTTDATRRSGRIGIHAALIQAILLFAGLSPLLLTGCAARRVPGLPAMETLGAYRQALDPARYSGTARELIDQARAHQDSAQVLLDRGKRSDAHPHLVRSLAGYRLAQALAEADGAAPRVDRCLRAVEESRKGWDSAMKLLVETEQVARRSAPGVPGDPGAGAPFPVPSLPATTLSGTGSPPLERTAVQALWREWEIEARKWRVARADLELTMRRNLDWAAAGKNPVHSRAFLHAAGRAVQELECRVRQAAAFETCERAAARAAGYGEARDLALRATLDLERGLRGDLRTQLEQMRAEAQTRQDRLYESLQQLEGEFARISREARGTIVSLSDILFDFDKAVLRRQVEFSLVRVATILNQFSEMKILVEGHTDNIGRAEYNLDLSRRRAKAVFDFLVAQGVDANRMTVEGYGMTRPVADNDNAEGRQRNRRVDLVIQDFN